MGISLPNGNVIESRLPSGCSGLFFTAHNTHQLVCNEVRQCRAIMSHDFKSNFSSYTQNAHLITGSSKIISSENLVEI